MFNRLKKFFQKTPEPKPSAPEEPVAEAWDTLKSQLLERRLGREHDMVMHAIIPFAIGGGLDLYYYPHGITGTAIATRELSIVPGEGSKSDRFDNYELVMFTRHAIDLDQAKSPATPFGAAHQRMNRILNLIARYSEQASLNPGETCEFPADMGGVGGTCLLFDEYASFNEGMAKNFGLLLVMEITRAELDYKAKHGSQALIELLKAKGLYPYSDAERASFV